MRLAVVSENAAPLEPQVELFSRKVLTGMQVRSIQNLTKFDQSL